MPMMINGDMPIPGENFTSDTKNYPWHQPPEFRSIGEALDKMSIKLTEKKTARGLLALADAGFPLLRISQMICMEGVAQGKWSVDMALLLVGPFTKIIEIMCDAYDIEYTIGIEEDEDYNTGRLLRGLKDLKDFETNGDLYKVVEEELPQIEQAAEEQDQPAEGEGGEDTDEKDLGEEGFATMMQASPADKKKEVK